MNFIRALLVSAGVSFSLRRAEHHLQLAEHHIDRNEYWKRLAKNLQAKAAAIFPTVKR